MSLLDRFIEPTKNYVNFKDLLINLSVMNNKPLYEIVNYLLCCDLNTLDLYYIDPNYRIIPIGSDDKNIINQTLESIKEIIRLGDINDEHWTYADDDSLDIFSHGIGDKLAKIIKSQVHFYFNKKDLLNFELLKDLLHFNANNDEQLPNNNQRIIEMQERIDELLDELADKDDSIEALLSKVDKNASVQQLIKDLAAANAKNKQQEQDINKLNDQLSEQSSILVDTQKKEGQGDSLLILGAVMHCIKDAAKINYTQELLTQVILNKYNSVSGISEGTLKKKFPESKKHLNQRLIH